MPTVRHLFAGSNSGQGFHSFFEHIIGSAAKRVYLLKGGPGTGKSRFMSDIAQGVLEKGYDQEWFFCSSDPLSLDAVAFPRLGAALIDATAPHALEAKWPGCRDQLICLGSFWSAEGLSKRREEIVRAGLAKQNLFASAFRYFAAACSLEENMRARGTQQQQPARDFEGELFARIEAARKGNPGRGKIRRLFASALTPDGYVSCADTLAEGFDYRCILQGAPGTGKSECLQRAAQYAHLAGLDVEIFHYPLNPALILHILIPELSAAVLSERDLECLGKVKGHRIDLGEQGGNCAENEGDLKLFRELVERGAASLRRAQEEHGRAEQYYSEQMNFKKLDALRKDVLQAILSL